jgi:cytochrome c biogenesis protein CcmG/thiol:disulfide interchange protein DsbE
LRGRFVLVNFFASWCPPCRSESPDLVRFAYSRPDGQKVALLGVVYGDTASNAAAFERQVGATWPSVVDPGERIAISYGVDDPPQSFLVAPNGRVVDRILGGVSVAGLDRLVRLAVSGT